jgi:C4-dicarboxylate-specific signal transduction histidine kinase
MIEYEMLEKSSYQKCTVMISIQDQGCGISEQAIKGLFKPFNALDEHK